VCREIFDRTLMINIAHLRMIPAEYEFHFSTHDPIGTSSEFDAGAYHLVRVILGA